MVELSDLTNHPIRHISAVFCSNKLGTISFFSTDHKRRTIDSFMQQRTRTDKIRKILRKLYPEVKTPLYHETPFQLLVATILSAQCTDKQVNRVTAVLFKHLKTPADFAGAQLKTIEKDVHSTGFYHNKAKNIKNCSQKILDAHGGRVPQTLEELVKDRKSVV